MKKLTFAMALAGLVSGPAMAAIELAPDLSVSGFGTIGAVHSNNNQADYAPSVLYPTGAGRTSSTSYGPDTKFGVQLEWKPTSRLSFVTQALSKQYANNSYSPQIEWAYGKFAVTSELDVRVGRIRPAIYMLSDYLDVNYANPWVRAPSEFYSSLSVSHMDGIDLMWRPKLGPVSLLVQPYAGHAKAILPQSTGSIPIDGILGINLSGSMGDFTLRGGYLQSKATLDTPGSTASLASAFAVGCRAGDQAACGAITTLIPNQAKLTFSSLGASYDNSKYFASGEIGKRNGAFDALTSWYVSGGTRIGKWTPYATYGSSKNNGPTQFTAGTFAGIPAFGLPSTNALGTSVLVAYGMDQHTVSLGVRYDLATNLALKTQWDHVTTVPKSGQAGTGAGLFRNSTTAFSAGANNVDLISVSLDFVF